MNTRNYEYIRGRTSNKIPITVGRSPQSSAQEGSQHVEGVDPRGYQIRQRELQLMQFEETRRYVVIQEKMSAYQTSAKVKTEFAQDHEAVLRSARARASSSVKTPPPPLQPTSGRQMPHFPATEARGASTVTAFPTKQQHARNASQSFQPGAAGSVKNVDALISWMSFPRDILLLDRHSRKAYTCVVEAEFVAGKECYALKWYEGTQTGPMAAIDHTSVLGGSVLLQDVTACQVSPKDSTVLVVQVSPKARALKSSGGRSALSIKFESDGECSKFMVGMNSMQEI